MYRKGVLALTVGLAACNSASQPVPMDVPIRTIEIDLQKAAVIPLSDISASDTGRLNTVADSIFSYQCFYKMPNPVIAVLTTQFSLGLQGTFSQGGKVSVGGIGTAPTAGLEYDVSNGQQQTLTLPMAFVTVADLPAPHGVIQPRLL